MAELLVKKDNVLFSFPLNVFDVCYVVDEKIRTIFPWK